MTLNLRTRLLKNHTGTSVRKRVTAVPFHEESNDAAFATA
jgi:hypothetical protein